MVIKLNTLDKCTTRRPLRGLAVLQNVALLSHRARIAGLILSSGLCMISHVLLMGSPLGSLLFFHFLNTQKEMQLLH